MDVVGSFRVNKVLAVKGNTQYLLFFLKDRILFIQTGGQFSDFRYILGYGLPILFFSILAGVLGTNLSYSEDAPALYMFIGAVFGALIGFVIVQKFIKPARKKATQLENLKTMSEEQLLAQNKNNFMILFQDVSRIYVEKSSSGLNGPRTGIITIEAFIKDTYDIAPGQNYNECASLVSTLLPDKTHGYLV